MDFFTVPTINLELALLLFRHHDRRHILHFNITKHPTSSWIIWTMVPSLSFSPVVPSLSSRIFWNSSGVLATAPRKHRSWGSQNYAVPRIFLHRVDRSAMLAVNRPSILCSSPSLRSCWRIFSASSGNCRAKASTL
jgi:hypothetical protein